MNIETNGGNNIIRILLIEDDNDLSMATAMGLEQRGYSVDAVYKIGRASCRERV